jgi:hypothetical protein
MTSIAQPIQDFLTGLAQSMGTKFIVSTITHHPDDPDDIGLESFHGPFESFGDAAEWADKHEGRVRPLWPPK